MLQRTATWGICAVHDHQEANPTPLLTFLTVRPVEPIGTLTDSPFVTKASISTASWALSCTKDKQDVEHAFEARSG